MGKGIEGYLKNINEHCKKSKANIKALWYIKHWSNEILNFAKNIHKKCERAKKECHKNMSKIKKKKDQLWQLIGLVESIEVSRSERRIREMILHNLSTAYNILEQSLELCESP